MFRKGISKSALRALAVLVETGVLSGFYLAGGTAAALQIGHRLSIDLDFFSKDAFKTQDGDEIVACLEKNGVEVSEIEIAPRTLHCSVEQTKISFLHYPYPLLENSQVFEGIMVASLLDITLMKIVAIAARGSKKDFIDLFFLLKKFPLQRVLEEFSKKFPVTKLDPYHYIKSLTYFVDAEGDPMPKMLVSCDWEKIKYEIEKWVARLVL